jgi:hypothetical protein
MQESSEEVITGQYGNDDIDQIAISIVRTEKQRWEVATAFVTDRVSFKMRNLIRIFRKNYYGVFDQPVDPNTQMEKVWYPLTEMNVEAVVKNIDLDSKDINFRSRTTDGYAMTDVTRAHVKAKLHEMGFGDKIKEFTRDLAIDGTAVWKTYEEYGKCQVRKVDLLNIYIDPTSPSIKEAYRFTERGLMFPEEISSMNGWRNTNNIVPVEGLPRTDPYWMNRATMVNSNVKMSDVYEMWGKIPLSLITGRQSDEQTEVDGHIVVSGIDGGSPRCHLIEKNLKKSRDGFAVKPYEEAWYTKVPNRWYGRGIAEKLLTLQIYANIVFNVRINRSRVSQLGLFKVRKGAGVTPQMLSRLPSNGVVVLNNLDDLQQLEVQEVGATSYKDEDVVNSLSERLTNAFEVATGESLPSSTPATNAAISNQNAKSGFAIIKESMGIFLCRWMDNHALPILAKELTADEIVRIESDAENFKDLVDRVVMYKASEALDKHFENGYIPSPQELQTAMDSAREKMMKSHMFVKLVQKVMADELDTIVYVTNEELDVPMTVQNLLGMLHSAPQFSDAIIKQTFDLLNLPMPKQNAQPPQQPPQGGVPVPVPGMPPATPTGMPPMPNAPDAVRAAPTMTKIATRSNVPQR